MTIIRKRARKNAVFPAPGTPAHTFTSTKKMLGKFICRYTKTAIPNASCLRLDAASSGAASNVELSRPLLASQQLDNGIHLAAIRTALSREKHWKNRDTLVRRLIKSSETKENASVSKLCAQRQAARMQS